MNEHTDEPWESEMSSEFDRRVRDLHEAPLTLEAVKGKAVGIRRKRRAVAAGSLLAAAAVIAPVAVAANGLGDSGAREVPAATSTPSATDSATQAPTDPGALGIGYLEGRTYHRSDGTVVTLPRVYQTATSAGDLVLAGTYDEQAQGYVVDTLDADGTVVDSFETISLPVSDRAEDVVAYVDAAGDLRAVWEGGEATLASGLSENTSVTAVTGGPSCESTSDCRVWIEDDSVLEGQQVVDADGTVSGVPGDVLAVNGLAENGGAAAVLESLPGDQESCGGIYDLEAGRYVVESCEYSFLGLSPRGTYADTTHAYLDGFGNGWAAIVDRDGTELARHTPQGGAITDQAWQDDEHLLVVVHTYEAQEWTIVRLGVDGSEEVVAGPVDGMSEDYVYRLGG